MPRIKKCIGHNEKTSFFSNLSELAMVTASKPHTNGNLPSLTNVKPAGSLKRCSNLAQAGGTSSNKKLLGTKGIPTRSKVATRGSWHYY